ncbi:MAG: hypothetical protein F6K14_04435 [Symploca sp. SIO2C1]|nr:hypothetical protein [Symploca sp. SIO2C1]
MIFFSVARRYREMATQIQHTKVQYYEFRLFGDFAFAIAYNNNVSKV